MEHLQQRLQDAQTRLEALGEMRNGAERISKTIVLYRLQAAQRDLEKLASHRDATTMHWCNDAITVAHAYIHAIELFRTETQL